MPSDLAEAAVAASVHPITGRARAGTRLDWSDQNVRGVIPSSLLCSEAMRGVHVDLSGNNLLVTVPPCVWNGPMTSGFAALGGSNLRLSRNPLSGPLSSARSALGEYVRDVHVDDNKMTGTLEDLVGMVPRYQLERVDVSNNRVSGGLEAVKGMTNLVALHVRNNRIGGGGSGVEDKEDGDARHLSDVLCTLSSLRSYDVTRNSFPSAASAP